MLVLIFSSRFLQCRSNSESCTVSSSSISASCAWSSKVVVNFCLQLLDFAPLCMLALCIVVVVVVVVLVVVVVAVVVVAAVVVVLVVVVGST